MALASFNASSEEESHYSENQIVLKDMLDCIGKSSAVFRSQQIDDPEISEEDKRHLAEKLLFESPILFLARFGQFLSEEHLSFFSTFKNDSNNYDIDFHIAQLRCLLSADAKKKLIRNRRFEALKRLENEGNYFSETEMEKREPLLYHQLVGQYLTEKEIGFRLKESNKDTIPSFSSFLIQQAEQSYIDDLRKQQEEDEAAGADSSDEETPELCAPRQSSTKWGADWEDEEMEKKIKLNKNNNKTKGTKITTDEKGLLLQEFRTHMYTKFLDGLEADFDYSLVDLNPDYDCLQLRSQDEEEKYFDEETCDNSLCTDTGVEDY